MTARSRRLNTRHWWVRWARAHLETNLRPPSGGETMRYPQALPTTGPTPAPPRELRLRGRLDLAVEVSSLTPRPPACEEWLDLRVPLERDAAGDLRFADDRDWVVAICARIPERTADALRLATEEPMEVDQAGAAI